MKFTVKREKLQKALQRLGSIIGSRSMFPVLSNVKIEAKENSLILSTTDLEIRLSTTLEATVESPGVSTAPANKLASLVGCFVGENVIFEINEKDHINLICGTSNFKLLGLPAEDFPKEEKFEVKGEIKIKESEFKKMVGSIAYAVSADDSRKALTGILFSVKEGCLTLVATDGKRLAMQEKAIESISGGDQDVIIPLKAAKEVRRLLDGDGDLTIQLGDKQCTFIGKNFELTTKLIDGNYPNYRQVVPASFSSTVDISKSLFLNKIETVSLILSDSSSYIILHFEDNQLKLQASSVEVGEGSDMVDIAYNGELFEVSFNPVFLADPLRNCESESIRMKFNDPLNPVAIEGDEGFLYVIMPIRKK
ncbi:MAG: DNA polymerase III subunit beta [Victivallales bacterium]|jgi:DNA polymerase-3 subunit beta|nr:DNA polymerase III subunit beta [Victivallales bacterium]